ncbi:MAG: hypothetical protein P4L92_09195 [Rudaea sp.]|nr:hypothetical protein [Rudaea sp.]
MQRCILFLTALLALPALAQTGAPAPEPAATTEAAPAAAASPAPEVAPATATTTPEMTPEQRLTQFHHDQINLLALHGDAGSLLAAALMAGTDAEGRNRPPALQSPALLKRAQTAGAENALVWWVTAAFDCHESNKNCPLPETLQKLESIDAENAAVWTLSLWHAQQAKDAPAARAALASAAQAKNYNDHFGALIDDIYQAEGVLPISTEVLNATGQNVSADGYRLISAAGIAAGVALPGYFALNDICKGTDPSDTALVADCLAVAQKMELSGSINSQNAGLSLKMAMLPAGPELDAARARQRVLSWQTSRISDLGDRLAAEPALSRVYTQALNESGDESAGVLAVLRSQGVALEPPVDWHPPHAGSTPKP